MSNKLVTCTLLQDVGKKLKRGDVVQYDPFKAASWKKRGLVEFGVKKIASVEKTAEEEPKPKPRKKKKSEEEPEEKVDG
jgi:hypothetical protein